jgi:hypothetical protein
MDLISFFKGKEDELLNRYKQLRERGRALNHLLVEQLPKAAIHECAKKLGLLKGATLVLGNEDELSVLFDYCLYTHRRGGKNVIDRYLETSPPPATSDEMLLLKAMSNSYYSLFLVEDVQTGKGATLRDLLRDKTLFLMDIGMGQSAVPGLMFAGRVLPLADFHMSSGAVIPLQGEGVRQEVMLILKKFLQHKKEGDVLFSPGQEAAFSAQIIRALLRAGALDTLMYRDIES